MRATNLSVYIVENPLNSIFLTTNRSAYITWLQAVKILHNLLWELPYWRTQRNQPKNQRLKSQATKAIASPIILWAGSATKSHSSASPQLGTCSGLLPHAITNTFLCQVSFNPAQYPNAVHHMATRMPGSAQGREQTAGSGGRPALLLLFAASTSLRFMVLGENIHLMHSSHSPPVFL